MEIVFILIIVVPVVAYSSVRVGRGDDYPAQNRTMDTWARDARKDRDNGR